MSEFDSKRPGTSLPFLILFISCLLKLRESILGKCVMSLSLVQQLSHLDPSHTSGTLETQGLPPIPSEP